MIIGVFGGTFNPPHQGHMHVARLALEYAHLDRLLVIPDNIPPHKDGMTLATARDRLEMCRLAFGFDERIEISSIEIDQSGKSYTVNTVSQLRKLYPDDELVLIVGADMLLSFDRWYQWQTILSMCRLCAFTRGDGATTEEMISFAREHLGVDAEKGEIIIPKVAEIPLSSSNIRSGLALSDLPQNSICASVEEYINKKKVYSEDTARIDEFKAVVNEKLSGERLIHSFGVADSAAYLAKLYGADEESAYCAGLLHDITKQTKPELQFEYLKDAGIELTSAEKNNPSLWHAMSGAAYIDVHLNVKSRDIINAVRYHTTGRSGMSLLERIVYTADFISAERHYPDVDVMRTLSDKSLDEADLYALKFCIGRLASQGLVIHPDSIDFYNELLLSSS